MRGVHILCIIFFLIPTNRSSSPIYVVTIAEDDHSFSSKILSNFIDSQNEKVLPTSCLWENVTCTHWEYYSNSLYYPGLLHIFSFSTESAAFFSIPIYLFSSNIITYEYSNFAKELEKTAKWAQNSKWKQVLSPPSLYFNFNKSLSSVPTVQSLCNHMSSQFPSCSNIIDTNLMEPFLPKSFLQNNIDDSQFYYLLMDSLLVMKEKEDNKVEKREYKLMIPSTEIFSSSVEECWNSSFSERCVFRIGLKELKILGKLGSGAHGHVYRTVNKDGTFYALKYSFQHIVYSDFNLEQDILRKLNATQEVAKVFDIFTNNQGMFLVMEFGHASFWEILLDSDVSIHFIQFYFKQMVTAVKVVHENGFIHHDIKPNNFLLVRGKIKLIDFGSALPINSSRIVEHNLQPEEFSTASDIFSLGKVLFIMLTKQTSTQVWVNKIPKTVSNYRVRNAKFNEGINPDAYDDLKSLLEGCMHKNISKRLTSEDILKHPFLYKYY